MNSFSRTTSAFVMAASLLGSSVAAVAQTSTANQAPATSSQTDPKKAPTQTVATTPAKSTKPLSTNEDPSMIGKRNINGGLIIPKLAGSTEKEVRQGREAAAEVDRQAKFVDDPIITEYVNRVGQNIVLHSDAKVPFTIESLRGSANLRSVDKMLSQPGLVTAPRTGATLFSFALSVPQLSSACTHVRADFRSVHQGVICHTGFSPVPNEDRGWLGAACRNRTDDLPLTRRLLYQLS